MTGLQSIFIAILNMSRAASYAAIAVIILRLFLSRQPKVFSYALWSVVLFRLVCPVSFRSQLSVLRLLNLDPGPGRTGAHGGAATVPTFVPPSIGLMESPAIASGIKGVDRAVNAWLPQAAPAAGVNPVQVWMAGLSLVWLMGTVLLVAYGVISYLRLKSRLQTATLVHGLSTNTNDSVYRTDQAETAFLCGFIRPKIYIPVCVDDSDLPFILAHEETHLRRRDYLVKALAFLALSAHWFNPLIWLSFALMSRDMEMSCDESVLLRLAGSGQQRQGIEDIRAQYSHSLLSLSTEKHGTLTAGPLAFGESDVERRIRNVLRYRKPHYSGVLVAGFLVLVAVIALAANPVSPAGPALPRGEAGSVDIETLVEDNIGIIMSSPKTSSNPQDYIDAHQDAYETILKLGGDDALTYMLSQFESGNAGGLRGHIMMSLCKRLLGPRNNVDDDTLSPQEWFSALTIRKEIEIPDFVYQGDDPIEKLVYATEIAVNSQPKRGFTVVAPKIFGVYEEGDMMKVFVTTYSATYRLYDKVLDLESGSVVPSAITYRKDASGNWRVADYRQARDGGDWAPSICAYCTMPVSGEKISGLADKIIEHYGDYDDIRVLHYRNLRRHLERYGIADATLTSPNGEVRFDMRDTRYGE